MAAMSRYARDMPLLLAGKAKIQELRMSRTHRSSQCHGIKARGVPLKGRSGVLRVDARVSTLVLEPYVSATGSMKLCRGHDQLLWVVVGHAPLH